MHPPAVLLLAAAAVWHAPYAFILGQCAGLRGPQPHRVWARTRAREPEGCTHPRLRWPPLEPHCARTRFARSVTTFRLRGAGRLAGSGPTQVNGMRPWTPPASPPGTPAACGWWCAGLFACRCWIHPWHQDRQTESEQGGLRAHACAHAYEWPNGLGAKTPDSRTRRTRRRRPVCKPEHVHSITQGLGYGS